MSIYTSGSATMSRNFFYAGYISGSDYYYRKRSKLTKFNRFHPGLYPTQLCIPTGRTSIFRKFGQKWLDYSELYVNQPSIP